MIRDVPVARSHVPVASAAAADAGASRPAAKAAAARMRIGLASAVVCSAIWRFPIGVACAVGPIIHPCPVLASATAAARRVKDP
ncbi:hypothetical protein GCM10007036_31450 [Alsobacter metallidurans]|uniref:Uncharacterized protein n=1 Tax=Alsobacter metallidurans TaxID=340221 RepID=A0A917I825_9HYPH|nr:hypothetical protein GCM10007036_31450 [Alsobacter metallidurans]